MFFVQLMKRLDPWNPSEHESELLCGTINLCHMNMYVVDRLGLCPTANNTNKASWKGFSHQKLSTMMITKWINHYNQLFKQWWVAKRGKCFDVVLWSAVIASWTFHFQNIGTSIKQIFFKQFVEGSSWKQWLDRQFKAQNLWFRPLILSHLKIKA